MILACKSDLERQVDPKVVLELASRYDSGLVEASKDSEGGKDKMRRSFEWLLIAILRDRRGYSFMRAYVRIYVCSTGRNDQDPDYRNPASPDNLGLLPPWENPQVLRSSTDSLRVATPTTASSMTSAHTVTQAQVQATPSRLQPASTMPNIPSSPSSAPTSPTRARSTGDLFSEHEKSKNQARPFDCNGSRRNSIITLGIGGSVSSDQLNTSVTMVDEADETTCSKELEAKQSRPAQWATLDELLDKLLFLAVSGDGMSFSTSESCFY